MVRVVQRLLASSVDDDFTYDIEDELEEDALEDDTDGDISDEEYDEDPDDFDDSAYRNDRAGEDDD